MEIDALIIHALSKCNIPTCVHCGMDIHPLYKFDVLLEPIREPSEAYLPHSVDDMCLWCANAVLTLWLESKIEQQLLQRQQDPHYWVRIANGHRRRARVRVAQGTHTASDIALQLKSQRGKCWHCGKKLVGKKHIDHLIPLVRGGSNDASNIVISCPVCNLSKGGKLTQEWNGKLF